MNQTELNERLKDGYWFTGERCSSCGASVNMMRCSASHGFFCEGCGAYTPIVWSENTIPHVSPVYGPSEAMIQQAVYLIRKQVKA